MCSHTPRFSYEVPKTTAPSSNDGSTGDAREGVPGWVWDRVGGWEGYTGYYPATQHAARGAVPHQRSGPRKSCKGWSGWVWGCGRSLGRWAGTAPEPTLRARSVPCRALPGSGPLECPPTANMARFTSIFSKVSQNGIVSPENMQKACHSPYF